MRESLLPFIDRSIIILNEFTPARAAARAMSERHVGCVLVSDHHHHIVGIVTDRDLAIEVIGVEAGKITAAAGQADAEGGLRSDHDATFAPVKMWLTASLKLLKTKSGFTSKILSSPAAPLLTMMVRSPAL
jgi:Mg/Co/Ni transporter MgtE